MAAAFQDGIIHVLSSSSDEDTEVDEAHSEGETEVDEASLLLLRSREEEEFCQPSVEQDAKRQRSGSLQASLPSSAGLAGHASPVDAEYKGGGTLVTSSTTVLARTEPQAVGDGDIGDDEERLQLTYASKPPYQAYDGHDVFLNRLIIPEASDSRAVAKAITRPHAGVSPPECSRAELIWRPEALQTALFTSYGTDCNASQCYTPRGRRATAARAHALCGPPPAAASPTLPSPAYGSIALTRTRPVPTDTFLADLVRGAPAAARKHGITVVDNYDHHRRVRRSNLDPAASRVGRVGARRLAPSRLQLQPPASSPQPSAMSFPGSTSPGRLLWDPVPVSPSPSPARPLSTPPPSPPRRPGRGVCAQPMGLDDTTYTCTNPYVRSEFAVVMPPFFHDGATTAERTRVHHGTMHPKLWLLDFTDGGPTGCGVLRLVIGSANLGRYDAKINNQVRLSPHGASLNSNRTPPRAHSVSRIRAPPYTHEHARTSAARSATGVGVRLCEARGRACGREATEQGRTPSRAGGPRGVAVGAGGA